MLAGLSEAERGRSVVIVQDAFTSYYETTLVFDLLALVRALGFRPWLAPFRPNGKPLHVHGFLGRFERLARDNAAMLRQLAGSGVPLVGIDPSMTLTYRAEYADALAAEETPRVLLVQEWLGRHLDSIPASTTSASVPAAAPLHGADHGARHLARLAGGVRALRADASHPARPAAAAWRARTGTRRSTARPRS